MCGDVGKGLDANVNRVAGTRDVIDAKPCVDSSSKAPYRSH